MNRGSRRPAIRIEGTVDVGKRRSRMPTIWPDPSRKRPHADEVVVPAPTTITSDTAAPGLKRTCAPFTTARRQRLGHSGRPRHRRAPARRAEGLRRSTLRARHALRRGGDGLWWVGLLCGAISVPVSRIVAMVTPRHGWMMRDEKLVVFGTESAPEWADVISRATTARSSM